MDGSIHRSIPDDRRAPIPPNRPALLSTTTGYVCKIVLFYAAVYTARRPQPPNHHLVSSSFLAPSPTPRPPPPPPLAPIRLVCTTSPGQAARSKAPLLELGNVGAGHEDPALPARLLDAALQVDVAALAPGLAPRVLNLHENQTQSVLEDGRALQ